MAQHATIWDLTDGIVVINLAARPERWALIQTAFASLGYDTPLERIPAVRGIDIPGYGASPWFRGRARDKAWAGRAGCTLSHRKAISHAKAQHWQSVLILEDDAEFTADFREQVTILQRVLEDNDELWQICYLGISQVYKPFRLIGRLSAHRALFGLFGGYTAHAYIVRQDAYDRLLDELPDDISIWGWLARHRAVDRWYSRNLSRFFKVVAVAPGLIGQYADFSDIGQRLAPHSSDMYFANVFANDDTSSRGTCFACGILLKSLWFTMLRPYDWIRGACKRIRGF
jgi:glycosyl transferase family 25